MYCFGFWESPGIDLAGSTKSPGICQTQLKHLLVELQLSWSVSKVLQLILN